jgi:predicted membrane protein
MTIFILVAFILMTITYKMCFSIALASIIYNTNKLKKQRVSNAADPVDNRDLDLQLGLGIPVKNEIL